MKRLNTAAISLADGNWFIAEPFVSLRSLEIDLKHRRDIDFRSFYRLTCLALCFSFKEHNPGEFLFPASLIALTIHTGWKHPAKPVVHEQLPGTLERLEVSRMQLNADNVVARLTNLQVLWVSECWLSPTLTHSGRTWGNLRKLTLSTAPECSFVVPYCPLLTSLSWCAESKAPNYQLTLPVIRSLELVVFHFTPMLELQVYAFSTLECFSLHRQTRLSPEQLNSIFTTLPKLETCSVAVSEAEQQDNLSTLRSNTMLFLRLFVFRGLVADRSTVRFGCLRMPKLRRLRLVNEGTQSFNLAASRPECELPELREISCRWFGVPEASFKEQLERLPQKPTYNSEF